MDPSVFRGDPRAPRRMPTVLLLFAASISSRTIVRNTFLAWSGNLVEIDAEYRDNEPRGRRTKYLILHVVIRAVVAVNLLHLLLLNYQPYFRAADSFFRRRSRGVNGSVDFKWMTVSSVLLPLCVGLVTWLLRRDRRESRSLIVDWLAVIVWFFSWWGFILYSILKYYPPNR